MDVGDGGGGKIVVDDEVHEAEVEAPAHEVSADEHRQPTLAEAVHYTLPLWACVCVCVCEKNVYMYK